MRRPEVTARPKPPAAEPLTDVRHVRQRTSGPVGGALASRAVEQVSSGETRGSSCVRTATSVDRTRDVCSAR